MESKNDRSREDIAARVEILKLALKLGDLQLAKSTAQALPALIDRVSSKEPKS